MIEVNKVFTIEKGSRKKMWKAIPHPNFDNVYALVSDHPYLRADIRAYDIKHIVGGSHTLEGVYEQAYMHT